MILKPPAMFNHLKSSSMSVEWKKLHCSNPDPCSMLSVYSSSNFKGDGVLLDMLEQLNRRGQLSVRQVRSLQHMVRVVFFRLKRGRDFRQVRSVRQVRLVF